MIASNKNNPRQTLSNVERNDRPADAAGGGNTGGAVSTGGNMLAGGTPFPVGLFESAVMFLFFKAAHPGKN
jgi:hypothetical protein